MAQTVKKGRESTMKHNQNQLREVDDFFVELRTRRTRARDSILTKEEFFQMMQVGKDPLDRVILALAIMGLRASEIARLDRSLVDLTRKTITIPDSLAKKGHGRVIPYGKFPRLAPLIDAYFIMADRIGISRIAIWSRVKSLARRAGLTKPVTPHGLRATGATWAANAGLSPQALRELFGWSSLDTARYYIEKSAGTASAELEEKGEKIL